MRLLVATLFAVLAFASPAFASGVTNVSVTNATPTNAAGGQTTYVVTLTTSATGTLTGANARVHVTFPGGTTFPGWGGGILSVGGTTVGGCFGPSGLNVDCWLNTGASIGASTAVSLRLSGVTNPPAAGDRSLTLSTTADLDPVVSPLFNVVTAGTITGLTVDNTVPSSAAGARTRYVASFTTSSTGALSESANSQLIFSFPAGTTFPGWGGGTITVGGVTAGGCYGPSGTSVTCWLNTNSTIDASTKITVAFDGVTNPNTSGTFGASTTSDPAVQTTPAAIVANHTITGLTVTNASPSNAAGARTSYVASFTTSSTGALAEAANSELRFDFPTGTTFPGWGGGTITVGGVTAGGCYGPSGTSVTCWLNTNSTINANTPITVTFDGVTNPGASGTFSASTTSDPAVQTTPATVVANHTISGLTVTNASPSNAAGARTRYVASFTTSSTGALAEAANSQLIFSFPAGTTFPGWGGGTITAAGTTAGGCYGPNGTSVTCWLNTNGTIKASTLITVTFDGVTNPNASGTFSASTTSDPTVQTTPTTIVANHTITGLTAAVSSLTPATRARYVVRFTTSSTGALAEAANSQLVFGFPAGTTFPGWTGGIVHDDTTGANIGGCYGPNGITVTCWLTNNATITAGDALRVTFDNITNPASAGPYQLTAATTSDPAPVTSPNYSQGEAVPPETTIEADAIEGTIATFMFSSGDPLARFECSLDGGPFQGCSSPYTLPDLPPGRHTFAVRAIDATGNPDPAPATRTFNVGVTPVPTTAPTAVPTATAAPVPTATPQPEFKQDVVAAPASGTIEVCDKPGVKCHTLAAGEAVPLGQTIDARKGVVVLTSVGADGKVETAKFFDGMFKVSQNGADHRPDAQRAARPVPEGQAGEQRGEEAQVPQALG